MSWDNAPGVWEDCFPRGAGFGPGEGFVLRGVFSPEDRFWALGSLPKTRIEVAPIVCVRGTEYWSTPDVSGGSS
jgi:hypothetical protein